MIKTLASIEVETIQRRYQFLCEPDSPIDEILSVLKSMSDYAEGVKKSAEAAKEEPAKEGKENGQSV